METQVSYWNRFWKRKIRRRTFLSGVVVGGAAVAAGSLVGCGGDEETGGTPAGTSGASPGAGEQPKRGGTWRWISVSPGHLDVTTTTPIHNANAALLVYHRLLNLSIPDYLVQEGLAKWEQPDNTTAIFTLPSGVKFHDKPPVSGRTLTAQDVVFSINRLTTPEPLFIHRADYAAIDKMEATDDLTVRITTKYPDASLLSALGDVQAAIIAPETIDSYGDIRSAEGTIGTGPFIVQDWDRDRGGNFVRNPTYYKEGLPYFEGAEQIIAPALDEWDAFLGGQQDEGPVPDEDVAGFNAEAQGMIVGSGSATAGNGVGFMLNLQRQPFGDVRVRRAFSLLFDRSEFLKLNYPGSPNIRPSVAFGQVHEFWNMSVDETQKLPWGWDPARKEEDYRQAHQLLEAAGFSPGNKISLEILSSNTPTAVTQTEIVASLLTRNAADRVETTIVPLDIATWRRRAAGGQLDSEVATNITGYDPDQALSKMHASTGGRNYGKWNDPEMDRLLERERSEFDRQARKPLVNEAQRYIADQAPVVWLGHTKTLVAVKDSVRGFVPGYFYWQHEQSWLAS